MMHDESEGATSPRYAGVRDAAARLRLPVLEVLADLESTGLTEGQLYTGSPDTFGRTVRNLRTARASSGAVPGIVQVQTVARVPDASQQPPAIVLPAAHGILKDNLPVLDCPSACATGEPPLHVTQQRDIRAPVGPIPKPAAFNALAPTQMAPGQSLSVSPLHPHHGGHA
jgi:hypothetical protein